MDMFRQLIKPEINDKLLSKRNFAYVILFLLGFNSLAYLYTSATGYPKVQRRNDAMGLSHDKAHKFLYFYYYKSLFPLLTTEENLEYSKESADEIVAKNPETLLMEYEHWARLGENARILTYMPSALVRGSPENPSVKLFNALFFFLALAFSYWGFWRVGKPLFGLIIVLLTNFSPFFLFEIFTNENIFGLMGATFILVLGLNAKWLMSKKVNWIDIFIIPVFLGLTIGFVSQIRNETIIVLVSALLIYLLANIKHGLIRIIPIFLIGVIYYVTTNQIKASFNAKFDETQAFVEKVGGKPYYGLKTGGHKFWHPVFCGLGDFDFKYGYKWDDKVAYRYAVPVLMEEYGMHIPYNNELHTDIYYDTDKNYYVKFDEIEEYESVVKEKVLADIKSDPLWFIYILFMRILTVLTITQPLPLLGWFSLFVLFVLWKNKRWTEIKLIIVAMPLSATSIIIFAARGTTYNSMFPLIALAVFLYLQHEFDPYLSKFPIVKRFFKNKRLG